MARFTSDKAINALVNGTFLQNGATGQLWAPDLLYAAISTVLQSSGHTLSNAAYEHDFMNVHLSNSGTISCNNNSETTMTWDTETIDGSGMHNTTNPSRITIPANAGGMWTGGVRISCPGNTAGRRQITVYLNGTATVVGQVIQPAFVGNTSVINCPIGYPFAAGDYIEAKYTQDSGSALAVTPAAFWLARQGRST